MQAIPDPLDPLAGNGEGARFLLTSLSQAIPPAPARPADGRVRTAFDPMPPPLLLKAPRPIVGSKAAAGVAERIVSELPRHEIYVEAFAGLAAVGRLKAPSTIDVFIEQDLRRAQDLASLLKARGDRAQVICADALKVLVPERIPAAAVLYCDPPYLLETRRSRRRYYQCDWLGLEQHQRFLAWVRALPCRVLVSHYPCPLYDRALKDWRSIQFTAGTRRGRATESLWMNYPESADRHDTRFTGAGFRERERIKRKARRWARRLISLPLAERAAVLQAVEASIADFQRAGPPGGAAPPTIRNFERCLSMNIDELSTLIGGNERCHNCRGFRTVAKLEGGDLSQVTGICLRYPVRIETRDAEVPVLDHAGTARTFKDGRVMTMTQRQQTMGYPPTHALLWCMGWEPKS